MEMTLKLWPRPWHSSASSLPYSLLPASSCFPSFPLLIFTTVSVYSAFGLILTALVTEQEVQHAQLASLTKLVMSTIVRYQFDTHLDFQLAPHQHFEDLMLTPLLAK